MSIANDKLTDVCKKLSGFADTVTAWADANEHLIGIERRSLHHKIRRFAARARELEKAVGQTPCVAVAGSAGSGKTHLIAALVGRDPAPLVAGFDDVTENADFLRQIRGDNSRQLGVVLRFSADDPGTPAKFPVALELLSQVDLIKILGSAYLSGSATGVVSIPSPEEIEAVSVRAGNNINRSVVDSLEVDDLWSLRDHFEKTFAGSPAIYALGAAGYWDYVIAMMPRLAPKDGLGLLSILWGGLPEYTALYEAGVGALEKLSNERLAYCAMAGLADVDPATGKVSPIAGSIMNTAPLYLLGREDDETVRVRSKHGAWAAIPRSVLAVLTSEVRISLRGRENELLANLDILEFPGPLIPGKPVDHGAYDAAGTAGGHAGASVPGSAVPALNDADTRPSRRRRSRSGAAHRRSKLLIALFAKHKSAYLFDRYSRLRKFTTLALCADPEDRDLASFSPVVAGWLQETHGVGPAEREHVDTGLFVVMTKLDQAIASGQADASADEYWNKRLDCALQNGIGRYSDWVNEWTPGRPFNNVYLLRAPHHRAPGLCDYLDNGLELCIRSSRASDVAGAGAKFLASTAAQRHIFDPGVAWQEALEPGDGGITYLAHSLAAVSNDREQRRQITTELTSLRRSLAQRLQRFYLSEDSSAQHDTRRRAGHVVVRALQHCADKQALGRLLRSLHVSDRELASLFYNLETNPYRGNAAYQPAPTLKPSLSASLNNIAAPDQAAAAGDTRRALGLEELDGVDGGAMQLAMAATEYWASTLRILASSPESVRKTALSQGALAFLVDELLAAANRHNLQTRIARKISAGTAGPDNLSQPTAQAAIFAAEAIGEFVNWLGFDESWAEHHPRRKGRAQTAIFPPRQDAGLAAIGEVRSQLGKAFSNDWSLAYMAMVEDNAEYLNHIKLDPEQDGRLGNLLHDLNPPEFLPASRSMS